MVQLWCNFGVVVAIKGVTIKVSLDPEVDLDLVRLARDEDRSKCRQVAVMVRRVLELRRKNPEAFKQLNLAN